MSEVYFISDTHFYHERIIAFANRPFQNAAQMNEAIVNNWNSVIGKRDTVYHLGDIGISRTIDDLQIIERLNGAKKVLILGNHDNLPITDYLQVFDAVYAVYKHKGRILSHYPIHPQELYGQTNIHGHTHDHNVTAPGCKYLNVSVENIGYKPIKFQDLVSDQFRGMNKK